MIHDSQYIQCELVNFHFSLYVFLDNDECSTSTSPCTGANTHCVNVPGTFECECNNGYVPVSGQGTAGLECEGEQTLSAKCPSILNVASSLFDNRSHLLLSLFLCKKGHTHFQFYQIITIKTRFNIIIPFESICR